MSKTFYKTLRPDLKARRSGWFGKGARIEVSGHGLKYSVPVKGANAETAALLNSKIPVMGIPPLHQ